MKKLFLLAAAILSLSLYSSFSTGAVHEQSNSLTKKAEIYKRVWHDGYWWIQVFTDGGDYVYEYLDPNQD